MTENKKKEFKLKEVCALWSVKTEKGNSYLRGSGDVTGSVVGFYNTNKKNPKEPDLQIYRTDKEGNTDKRPIISLWCNVGVKGIYLTGKLFNSKVVGFVNSDTKDGKRPKVSIYFSLEQNKGPKTEEPVPPITSDELPF